MPGLFVTATGTEVGKTFVSAGLLRAARRAGLPLTGLKPVMSGYDPAAPAESDAGALLAAMGRPATPEAVAAISPFRFAAPLSPDMAAAREGRRLDPGAVTAFCRDALAGATPVLVEGVGGVMVPLDGTVTTLDVMAELALPVLLVTASGLGALSHGLAAHAVLASRGLRVVLTVVNETSGSTVPLADTVATLRCFAFPLMALPRDPAEAAFDAMLAELAAPIRGGETST